ncbi:MFS general substrate transporter [Aaosphaeria arxii CBS 175.79]|uniref:MFS general substrate transporter n=1 Tax=Aaosphaeria arxii CBS 175.79 TaxID=1450172 RepID=A0A6A5XPK0_9PLEO|nr:MFS general substrate transporter [Aaosphaeria arxii CBS 175.79]KAF2014274.1 MFS general substrate transporter [Aaosphaeria arxii CBS 175.79]
MANSDKVEQNRAESVVDDPKTDAVVLKSGNDILGTFATVKKFWKAVLICNLLCIAAACDGYQINLNGNIIANQGFTHHVGFRNSKGVYTLHANYTALWGAMQSLGQLIGMVLMNPISDIIGRKMTLYAIWIILVASIIVETLVRDWRDWAGAKVLAGIGIGALQATLPVYVTEWSPVNIRGAMIVCYGFWTVIGKFLANLVLMLVQQTNPMNYKVPILTQWGFVGMMLPIFLWLPETPAYYAERDLHEAGKKTLARVNGKVEGYDIEVEYAIILNTIREEKYARSQAGEDNMTFSKIAYSYIECFQRANVRRTLGSTLPGCAQQLAGLSFLNTYASLFFKQSGFQNAFLITTIMCSIQLFTAICLIFFTDRFGRRNMVFTSVIICTATLLIVGVLAFVEKTTAVKNFLIFVACTWAFANATVGSLGYAFVGEVASQKLRARTAGVASGLSVIFGLTFNTSLPIILDVNGANWGYKTAWLFFGTGLAVCIALYFFLPECSRRNAAEIDEMYEKNVPAWKMHRYVTDIQAMHQVRT